MTEPFLPYSRQTINDDDVDAVVAALRSPMLTTGPLVDEFERALAQACDVAEAVVFMNGTAALHGACFAAGVEAGDETVTSAISFAASANCGAYLGATPRFADVDSSTINMDPASLREVVGSRTRAIIPVHFAGLPMDLEPVRAIADGCGAAVIEDAAHALGAFSPSGRVVGSCEHSTMTVLSFHAVKAVTTAEGGAVTTNDPDLAARMRRFRHHGIARDRALLELPDEGDWYHEMHDLGFNYRITDLQCALGLSQLQKLEQFVVARNQIASWYAERLGSAGRVRLPAVAAAPARHAYHLYTVRVPAERRRGAFDALRADNVGVNVHYLPIYRHPWYRKTFGYSQGMCPNAEAYYSQTLSLPIFPGMTRRDVDRVASCIERALA